MASFTSKTLQEVHTRQPAMAIFYVEISWLAAVKIVFLKEITVNPWSY